MNGQEWCERYGVAFDWTANGYQLEDGWEYHSYTITLERDGEQVKLPWKQGLLVDNEPTADELLPIYAREAMSAEATWVEFVEEYDADPDSLSTYRVWEALVQMRRDLYDFMRSEAMWEDFLGVKERDEDDES